MDSSVMFSQSTESTSISMPSIDQKPELGIPNTWAVKGNEYVMGPELTTEATTCNNVVLFNSVTVDNILVFFLILFLYPFGCNNILIEYSVSIVLSYINFEPYLGTHYDTRQHITSFAPWQGREKLT